MKTYTVVDWVAVVLVVVGGLNWGLVGVFDFNLVEFIFGSVHVVERVIYVVVGIAAVYMIYSVFKSVKS